MHFLVPQTLIPRFFDTMYLCELCQLALARLAWICLSEMFRY